jgi:hypothetical protein
MGLPYSPLTFSHRLCNADPQLPCWEGTHQIYVVIAIAGLIVYTVGLPLCLGLILEYGRVHNLFKCAPHRPVAPICSAAISQRRYPTLQFYNPVVRA